MVSRVASVELGGRQREQLRRTAASDLDNSVNTGANVARRVLAQAKIGWLDSAREATMCRVSDQLRVPA